MYDDLIMEHIRNARNYHVLEGWNRMGRGTNPLCGDELSVHVILDRQVLEKVSFQCVGCGVSMASASIMTELVTGMSSAAARSSIDAIEAGLWGRTDVPPVATTPGARAIAATARKFPSRARCAMLPWSALLAAIENGQ